MNKLIADNELGLPLTTPLDRAVVRAVKWVIGLDKLNDFYSQLGDTTGTEFAHAALEQLDVTCKIDQSELQRIPATGGVIIIVNHPHGALDGLLLLDTVLRQRTDAKFMGNFVLARIKPFANHCISVDPFENQTEHNIAGIRQAKKHLSQGGALIIFPAAEVATYQRAFGRFGDHPWPKSIIRFIRSTSLPVVPIHISGRNSLTFHLSGKIHPRLRTLRLVRELLNKSHKTVEITIGHPIQTRMLQNIASDSQACAIMRANISVISSALTDEVLLPQQPSNTEPITSSNAQIEAIQAEIDALSPDALLSSLGTLKLYFCAHTEIENTLKTICALREQTLGANNHAPSIAIDTDAYDLYYHHLFLWDSEQQCVIGAYRVGFGEELFRQMGIDAFYTHTMFDFSHKFFPALRSTIELGRSFIIEQYQRKAQPLLLLWRGLLMILMRSEGYRYLMGTVGISNEYSATARRLMVSYIKTHHWSADYSRFVVARQGIRSLSRPLFDNNTISALDSIDYIDKFIGDIDILHSATPALLKRYLQLGGEVLSLNIDSKSNDSLDALMMLDIRKIDPAQLKLLTSEFNLAQCE